MKSNVMEILFLLLPITLLVSMVIAIFFLWTVNSGQYEDLDGEAHRILMDDDQNQLMVSKDTDS